MIVRYPDITVTLSGQPRDALKILGIVIEAMRRKKVPQADRNAFMDEATAGDYDHLLRTCMLWVHVE